MLCRDLIDHAGIEAIALFVQDVNSNVRHAFIEIYTLLLLSTRESVRLLPSAIILETQVSYLCRVLDSQSDMIRGKIYLLVALLCDIERNCLVSITATKLLHSLEHDADAPPSSSSDVFLRRCCGVLIGVLQSSMVVLTVALRDQLSAVHGRKHPSTAQARQLRPVVRQYSMVLAVAASPLFRKWIDWSELVYVFTDILECLPSLTNGHTCIEDAFEGAGLVVLQTSMAILEVLARQTAIFLSHHLIIAEGLLPSLAPLMASPDGNVRLTAVRVAADILVIFRMHTCTLFTRKIIIHNFVS